MSAMARLLRYLRRAGVDHRDSGERVSIFYADDAPYYVLAAPAKLLSTPAPGGAATSVMCGPDAGLGAGEVLVMCGLWPGDAVPMTAEEALMLVTGRLLLTANGLPTGEPRKMLPEPATAQLATGEPNGFGAGLGPQEVIVRKEGE